MNERNVNNVNGFAIKIQMANYTVFFAKLLITGVTGGVVVGQIASLQKLWGSDEQWHIAMSAYLILVLVCFLPFYWFPESPKYLYIVRDRRDLAKKGKIYYRIFFMSVCALSDNNNL